MNETEIRLAKDWYVNKDMAPSEIASALKRDKSCITRLIADRFRKKKTGRKRVLSEAQVCAIEEKLKSMIKKANGEKEVTLDMLKKTSRCKASTDTLARRLHERGIYFYDMRQKPLLTEKDVADRYAFGKKYSEKPQGWWTSVLHLIIDVKFFLAFLNAKARRHAAQSGARGVYRRAGEGLGEGYVKPNPKLKYNTGAKGVHVLAGVGNGRVLLWEYIDGTWNSYEAARLYEGPMLNVLKAAYPGKKRFRVLEDNDPSGFKSRRGVEAKERARIDPFVIPGHSPQLNLCDYWLWREVNTRMRRQERAWPAGKVETRDGFMRRLKRTAMSSPAYAVDKSIGHMKVRCQRLVVAKGGQIEG